MSYCLSPDCRQPQNPDHHRFCQSCGSPLWLSDRYCPVKVIGQGGFGRTFLAIDDQKPSKPRCVIKQFFPQAQTLETRQKAAELFQQEATRLDELGKHPQLPELFAHLEHQGVQYLVQEFIDGENLEQILEQEGAFTEAQIRSLLQDLLPVLQFVHAQQVIHRDIKPANIIRRNADQKLVLVDFGAAKLAAGTALAKTGTVIGSAGYAAPEQAIGKAVFASDLYSLGVSCIRLLTQMDPFDLYSISEGSWVWREYLPSPVSDRLVQILNKMLESATKHRYQNSEAVLTDLTSVLTSVQIFPTPVPSDDGAPDSKEVLWGCIRTIAAHTGMFAGVRCLAVDPDNTTLASGSDDYTIKLWDLKTYEQKLILSGHTHFVRAVAFNQRGNQLISGSYDRKIKLWNLEAGPGAKDLLGHQQSVSALLFSPTHQTIISSSDDATIRLWDFETGQQKAVLSEHQGYVEALTLSPDQEGWLSGGQDGKIHFWSFSDQQIRYSLPLPEAATVKCLALSPDQKVLVAGDSNGKLYWWDLNSGGLIRTVQAHAWTLVGSGVNDLQINPQGTLLASAGDMRDHSIKLWNLKTGDLLQTLAGHQRGVTSIRFTPDGSTLISGSYDKTIRIWKRGYTSILGSLDWSKL